MVTRVEAYNKGTKQTPKEELQAEVLAAVQQALVSDLGQELLGQLSGRSGGLDEREQSLVQLRQLVATAMAQTCLQRERGYQGARHPCPCGRTARYVRDDEKRYVTLVGEVNLQRAEYWCPACGALRPLEAQWDLPQGHYTRGVIRLATLVGSYMPFERGAGVLAELSGIGMSDSQVRLVCERVGAEIGRQQAAETAQALRGETALPEPATVLVMAMDGAHVHTREAGWKETKVGVAARYEWQEREGKALLAPTAAEYTALVGAPEPLGRSLYGLSQRLGGEGREATIVLGDGAPWIWNQAQEHFPGAVQVLDFYHLAEHVHATARALFAGNEAKGQDWAETVLVLLRAEETAAALEYLQRSGEATADLIRYITEN